MLSGKHLELELSFWEKQLAGVPTALDLPIDRLRPAQQTFRGATHVFDLGQAIVNPCKGDRLQNHGKHISWPAHAKI